MTLLWLSRIKFYQQYSCRIQDWIALKLLVWWSVFNPCFTLDMFSDRLIHNQRRAENMVLTFSRYLRTHQQACTNTGFSKISTLKKRNTVKTNYLEIFLGFQGNKPTSQFTCFWPRVFSCIKLESSFDLFFLNTYCIFAVLNTVTPSQPYRPTTPFLCRFQALEYCFPQVQYNTFFNS